MIIGIDLGTSTSEIAYINKEGLPQVIPNHLGDNITPSIVYIDESLKPVVGLPALEKVFTEPENTFLEVKRLMGTNTILNARGKTFTPVDISSYILKYLIGCAEEFLKEKVESVVITVPAYFTDAQRRDTLAAGEMLGVKVERIINEPTAASLDYGISRREDCDYILVYDLGGGTLDVTVLELFEGVVEVMASCGNNELGGKDFDQALINEFVLKIKKESKVDISSDLRAMARLKQEAEKCKIALSSQERYEIDLPFLSKHNNNPIGFCHTITKNEFEALIKDKVNSSLNQINSALTDAALNKEDLNLVLLVGGSTKIPYVKEFLSKELGITPKNFVDPDLAVVQGAAIQGGIIEGTFNEDSLVLADVCPYSLSTEVLTYGLMGEHILECDILIKRNTTIPTSVSKIYTTCSDNQEKVVISAYQGESTDPSENIYLNGFSLSGIPRKKAGKESIEITFKYDLNGLLVVSGEIVSTGKKASIDIETSNTSKQVDLTAWVDCENAKPYKTVIRKCEKLIQDIKTPPNLSNSLKTIVDNLKRSIIEGSDIEILNGFKEELLEILNDIR